MIMKSTGPNAKQFFLRYFQPEIKFLLTNTWLQFSISVQLFKNFILLLLMLSLSNIKNCWLMTWGLMTWNMQVFQISKKKKIRNQERRKYFSAALYKPSAWLYLDAAYVSGHARVTVVHNCQNSWPSFFCALEKKTCASFSQKDFNVKNTPRQDIKQS